MSRGLDSIADAAARMGIVQKRMPPDYRQLTWLVICSKCASNITHHWPPHFAPEGMKKQLRQKGWDVDVGMRPLCPRCCHAKDMKPLPKPDHQNFEPFISPIGGVGNALLMAAEEKAREIKLKQARADLETANQKLAETKQQKRDLCGRETQDAKMAAMQARAAHARKHRLERLAAEKAAREAGAEALHIAKLKEAASMTAIPSVVVPVENQTVETVNMKPAIAPAPKITHAVFQLLDDVFDPAKRLYRNGYTDQRVARDCGTSEDVVKYLREETFGQLAEDPRISSIRDDLELLRLEAAEQFAKLQKTMGEIASRVEQLARK